MLRVPPESCLAEMAITRCFFPKLRFLLRYQTETEIFWHDTTIGLTAFGVSVVT